MVCPEDMSTETFDLLKGKWVMVNERKNDDGNTG